MAAAAQALCSASYEARATERSVLAVTYGSGSYFAVAVADVDGDTHPDIIAIDLACASGNSGCVSLLIGNGDGTFQDGSAYALGIGFSAIAVADVNGDGEPDVIATPAGNGGNNTPPGTVGVLLNAHVSTTKSATVATLVSSLNPSVYGQKVTWTDRHHLRVNPAYRKR